MSQQPKLRLANRVIKGLAKEYNMDEKVVRSIVFSPWRFLARVMSNDYDQRAVRFKYFGVFYQKRPFLKAINSSVLMGYVLLKHINYTYMIMTAVLQFPITSVESAKKVIREAVGQNDYEKLKYIFRAFIRVQAIQ